MKFLLIAFACVSVFASCGPPSPLSLDKVPDDSVYQLSSDWQNESGAPIKLIQFSGRVQIVGLIFTHCSSVCPMIVSDMKSIEGKIPFYRKDQINFLLISIDPERDTVAVRAKYLTDRNLDSRRWSFITAKPSDVSDLASILGVKIQAQADGSFSHSKLITILNPVGRIGFQDSSITDGGENFVRAAVESLK